MTIEKYFMSNAHRMVENSYNITILYIVNYSLNYGAIQK